MKNINQKIGATLLTAAIMAGTAVIPMSNAAVEAAVEDAKKPSIKYQAHVQNEGWKDWVAEGEKAGSFWKRQRMEAIKISLENCEGVTLHVKAHIQDYGDREFTVTAADAEKVIGTQYERKRIESITITTEGLKELGYKLQYQAHVQDIGDQGWREEGEEAGTHWQKKRIESIQMRIVEDEEAKELADAKTKAVDTLTSYDCALAATLSEGDYKEIGTKIGKAMEDIKNATTKEVVASKYAEIEKAIKEINPAIEVTAERIAQEKEKAKTEAEEAISEYTEIVPNSTILTGPDKAIITTRIETAMNQINTAKTPKEISKISRDLVNLLEDSYGLKLDKTRAINNINSYVKEDATEGVKSYATKQVEAVTKAVDSSSVTSLEGTATDVLRNLITAQETAKQIFDIYYNKTIVADELLNSEKEAIKQSIATYRANANKAENSEAVSGIVDAFKAEMAEDNRYKDVVANANKAIVEVQKQNEINIAIDEAIRDLEAAINSEYGEEADKEKKKLANEYKGEYIDEIKAVKVAADVVAKLEEVEAELFEKVEATADYKVAYEFAMDELDEYAKVVPTLELTNLEEVNKYIAETKQNVFDAKTDDEVYAALDSFEKFMESLKITSSVGDSKVKQAQKESIDKLNKYLTSEIKEVKEIAENAIEDINNYVEETTEEDSEVKINYIKNTLYKTAIDNINTSRFNTAMANAYNEMEAYADETKYSAEVVEAAKAAQEEITAVELDLTDVETSIKAINTELEKGIQNIRRIDRDLVQRQETLFNNAKEALLQKVKDYQEMAKEMNDKDAIDLTTGRISMIEEMTFENSTIEELADKEASFDLAIARCESYVKGEAIETLRNYKNANSANTYANEKKAIDTILDDAMAQVKEAQKTADTTLQEEVDAILDGIYNNEGASATGMLAEYDTLHDYKAGKIADLEAKKAGVPYGSYVIRVNNAIEAIKNETIKLTNAEQGTYENVSVTKGRVDGYEAALPYKVEFVNGEDSSFTFVEKAEHPRVTAPETPTKESTVNKTYTFAGWFSDETLSTEFDVANTDLTEDKVLYAKFTEATRKYTVTYENEATYTDSATSTTTTYEFKTAIEAAEIEYNTSVASEPAGVKVMVDGAEKTPTLEWYVVKADNTLGDKFTFGTTPVKSNITLRPVITAITD